MADGLAASGLSAIGSAVTNLLADGAQSVSSSGATSAAAAGANDAATAAATDTSGLTGADPNLTTAPEDTGLGTRATPARGPSGPVRLVIGRTADLLAPGAIGPDEYALLDKPTPDLKSFRANWYRNASVLRAELRAGITQIRDASPGDVGGRFLNAERNLLQNRGWTFDHDQYVERAMTIAPIPSRLGFVAAGRSALDFVTRPPYSRWLTDQDEGRIGYEGDDVILVLLHDPLSYELDIALWRPSVEDEIKHPFALSDMIRVVDAAKAQAYRRFSATSEGSVRRGIAELVSDFRRYGVAALTGDKDFYWRMSAARSEAARQFGMDMADKATRKNAEQAWQQRDFQSVVKAYRSIEGRLSRVERERLNYASQRIME